MVLKRNLEYISIGYDSPTIPRARRSVRRRSFCKKTFDEGQLCAFELLAFVAGKLLQESESSSTSSNAAAGVHNHNVNKDFIKLESQYNVEEATRTEQEEQGSTEGSVVSSAICLLKSTPIQPSKEAVDTLSEELLKQISSISNSACSGKVGSDVKPVICRSEDEFIKLPTKIVGSSPKCGESFGPNVDNGIARGEALKGGTNDFLGIADKFSSKVSVESCGKLPLPIHLSEKADLGHSRGSVRDPSYAKHRNDVKKEGTDDDEIISQSSNPISRKPYGSPTSVDNCKIRKLLTSKYWKSAPKLKDCKPANSGSKRNNINHSGKSNYEHENVQPNTPFKKRKLFGQTSVVTHDGGISSEGVSNLTAKEVHNWSGSLTKHHEDNKISSSSMVCQRSSSNSHVKLSVKSFKVPELLIEVPESTTVGSLKKNVLDAINIVLGGGLRVGVLLHGKKICDDSKTLLQTGISEYDNLNDLNFILEPSTPSQLYLNPSQEDCPVLPTCHSPKDYVNRSLNPKQELSLLDKPNRISATGSSRICQDLVPFSGPKPENKLVSDSRVFVPIPENVEALAAVPTNTRQRRTEMGQRRTRRPFSVTEVEALVQTVEKLGTGRWRDVKLCAFENAKHRTYVDLKDKWKTLVHTARISPQQRRGEPVPQQLLDRVLAAHAYWSQHQVKHHGKQHLQSHQVGLLKISNSPAEKVTA